MNANGTVQSASPDVGSAPGSMGNFAGQPEVMKQVLCVLDKKVRNMEKKKVKLLFQMLPHNNMWTCCV